MSRKKFNYDDHIYYIRDNELLYCRVVEVDNYLGLRAYNLQVKDGSNRSILSVTNTDNMFHIPDKILARQVLFNRLMKQLDIITTELKKLTNDS